jgi:hypothetical protein
MTALEYEKRLLLQKIATNRSRMRDEIASLRGRVRPLARAFGWGRRLAPLWPLARPAMRKLGRASSGVSTWADGRWWRYLGLLVVVVPLVLRTVRSSHAGGAGDAAAD